MGKLIQFPEEEQSDEDWLHEIMQLPESHPGREILVPEIPQEWLDWPCHIEVRFSLNMGTCVYPSLFEEYEVNNLHEAFKKLFVPKSDDLFLHYRVHCVGVTPPYRWDATWPLLRRGNEEGLRKRGKIQGAVPWHEYYDDTLFEVWNKPLQQYFYKTRSMLRVGGRTKEEAAKHWALISSLLRRVRKEIRGNAN